jgi:hypothetical protein
VPARCLPGRPQGSHSLEVPARSTDLGEGRHATRLKPDVPGSDGGSDPLAAAQAFLKENAPLWKLPMPAHEFTHPIFRCRARRRRYFERAALRSGSRLLDFGPGGDASNRRPVRSAGCDALLWLPHRRLEVSAAHQYELQAVRWRNDVLNRPNSWFRPARDRGDAAQLGRGEGANWDRPSGRSRYRAARAQKSDK